jgi:hypothetical protein
LENSVGKPLWKALVEIRPAKDSLNRRIVSVEVGCDSPSGSHLGIPVICCQHLKHSTPKS